MFPIYIVNPILARYSPLGQGDPGIPTTWRTTITADPIFTDQNDRESVDLEFTSASMYRQNILVQDFQSCVLVS